MNKIVVFFALLWLSSFLMAVDVNWVGPITFTPVTPVVGEHVVVKSRITISGGDMQGLVVTGRIDGKPVYSNTFAEIKGPKSMIIQVNWVAAHATQSMHVSGKPSSVNVEFSFKAKHAFNTGGNTTQGVIQVKDAPPTQGGALPGQQPKPDLHLTPCFENANGPTDLFPLDFSFTYIRFGKFSYRIVIKNMGPRCIKTMRYKITYLLNGVETLYKEVPLSSNTGGFLIEAGASYTVTGAFDRREIPHSAFKTIVDSQLQEISYKLDGLKLILDPSNDVMETNEGNNTKTVNLEWVEK